MIRRPRRSLPATLVALALLAAAFLIAVSCGQLLLDQTPLLPFAAVAQTGAAFTWNQVIVLAAAAVVAVLGLALMVAALSPGAPTIVALAPRDGQPHAGATRRSLARALTMAARNVDGVDKASVRVRPRTVTAAVRTPLREPADLPEQVRTAITERLDDIALAQRAQVRVRTTTRST